MNRRNLILAVVAAHICIFGLAGLFGGCAKQKGSVKLTTAAPVTDVRAPEGEPESLLEPKGMVEETDLLVARQPDSIPAAGGEQKSAAESEEKMIDAAMKQKEKAVEASAAEKEARVTAAMGEKVKGGEVEKAPAAAQGPRGPVVRQMKPPAATPAAQPAGHAAAGTHTVAPGESLWRLSQRYGVSVAEIASANNLQPNASLKIGQVLVIPGGVIRVPEKREIGAAAGGQGKTFKGDEVRGGAGLKRHVVQKGESLAKIATRYKVSLKELSELNKIQDASKIKAGQTLLIP